MGPEISQQLKGHQAAGAAWSSGPVWPQQGRVACLRSWHRRCTKLGSTLPPALAPPSPRRGQETLSPRLTSEPRTVRCCNASSPQLRGAELPARSPRLVTRSCCCLEAAGLGPLHSLFHTAASVAPDSNTPGPPLGGRRNTHPDCSSGAASAEVGDEAGPAVTPAPQQT